MRKKQRLIKPAVYFLGISILLTVIIMGSELKWLVIDRSIYIISNTFITTAVYERHVYDKPDNPIISAIEIAFPVAGFAKSLAVEDVINGINEEGEVRRYYEIVGLVEGEQNGGTQSYYNPSQEDEAVHGYEVVQDYESEQTNGADQAEGTEQNCEKQSFSFCDEYNEQSVISQNVISQNDIPNLQDIMSKYYVIPHYTSMDSNIFDLQKAVYADMAVHDKIPCIVIYHTHASESFCDYSENPKTIVDVGEELSEILRNHYGYTVYHVTTVYDMMEGTLDRGKAYNYAEAEIAPFLQNHPEVDMVIDLHRDGVDENLHFLTEIDGKSMAKLMLFNGISYSNEVGEYLDYPNENRDNNLTLTYQIMALGEKYYPGLFRCIYIDSGRYNLHLHKRAMLIEAGAQTNSYEEVANSMEPLAKLIYMELTGGY